MANHIRSEVGRPVEDAPRPVDDEVSVGGGPVPRLPEHVRRGVRDQRLVVARPGDSAARLVVSLATASATAALVVLTGAWWAAALHIVIGGMVLAGLYAAEHEGIHGSLFGGGAADTAVGVLCGTLCANPFAAYRSFHLRHHSHSHAPGDPEPITVLRNRWELLVALLVAVPAVSGALWAQFIATLAGRGPDWARRTRRHSVEAATLAGIAGAGVAATGVGTTWGWGWVAVLWAAPLLVSFPIAGVFGIAEHYECGYGPGSAFTTTRTVRSNAAVRFLIWNANHHTGHHLLPSVPGRNLEALQELIEDRCEFVERSYTGYYLGLWRRVTAGDIPSPAPWQIRSEQ
jgi:fatty acid desaturase